jgi:hypothetical protein
MGDYLDMVAKREPDISYRIDRTGQYSGVRIWIPMPPMDYKEEWVEYDGEMAGQNRSVRLYARLLSPAACGAIYRWGKAKFDELQQQR